MPERSGGGAMSKNEFELREHSLPSVFRDSGTTKIRVSAECDKSDGAEYSFICRPDQDTEIRIAPNKIGEIRNIDGRETENTKRDAGCTVKSCTAVDDIIDVAYEDNISEKERLYYSAALVCGIFSEAMSEAPSVFSDFDFDRAAEKISGKEAGEKISGKETAGKIPGKEEGKKISGKEAGEKNAAKGSGQKDLFKDIVIFAARLDGFRGKEYKKALRYLVSYEGTPTGRLLHESLSDLAGEEAELSAAPTLSGLLFSMISQFSGMLYYADDKGNFREAPVPDHYVIGDSAEDKILLGIMYWGFYASAISVRPGRGALKDTGIPGALRGMLEDIVSHVDASKMPEDFREAEMRYSEWLGKMVVRIREDGAEGMEHFFFLREKMKPVCPAVFPVVLNICMVRATYIFCRIREEAAAFSTISFMDLFPSDPGKILPEDHRILSNMCRVSADAFAAVHIGHVTLKQFFQSGEKPADKTPRDFVSAVNIAGIGSFAIALADRARYAYHDRGI